VLSGLLWKFLPLPKHDVVVESRGGTRLVVPMARNAGALYPVLDIFAFSAYESSMRLGETPFVIDIGANIGAFMLWLAERYPGLRGACYEPDPEAFAYLRRNVDQLAVAAHCEAVADRTGTARLFRPERGQGAGTIRSVGAGPDVLDVPVVAFDRVTAETDESVALVKMDCEGSEFEIVLGSSSESWRRVQGIVIEYHPIAGANPRALVEKLEAHGFLLVQQRERARAEGTFWFSRGRDLESVR
jgi:FkbM family methyltransferase